MPSSACRRSNGASLPEVRDVGIVAEHTNFSIFRTTLCRLAAKNQYSSSLWYCCTLTQAVAVPGTCTQRELEFYSSAEPICLSEVELSYP